MKEAFSLQLSAISYQPLNSPVIFGHFAVILGADFMSHRLTTVHEKGLDSRSPAFAEDKFRGNDNNCVIPAKAGIHWCCVGLFS